MYLIKIKKFFILCLMMSMFSVLVFTASCNKQEPKNDQLDKKEWLVTQELSDTTVAQQPELGVENTDVKTQSKVIVLQEEIEVLPDLPDGLAIAPYSIASSVLLDRPIVKNAIKKAKGKIHVIEFFNYPCPGCAYLDPMLQSWLQTKPKDVEFSRIPVIFYPHWVVFAKVYYLIESLADQHHIKDKQQLHADFFQVFKQNPEIGYDLLALQAFFIEKGLLKEKNEKLFLEKLESFVITDQNQLAYAVKTIPSFVILGKNAVYLTAGEIAGGHENIFPVINYLIAKDKIDSKKMNKKAKKYQKNKNKKSGTVNS